MSLDQIVNDAAMQVMNAGVLDDRMARVRAMVRELADHIDDTKLATRLLFVLNATKD
jgi:hypothetical protein